MIFQFTVALLLFGATVFSLPIKDFLFVVDNYLGKYGEILPELQSLVRDGPSNLKHQIMDALVQFNRLSSDPLLSKCYGLSSAWVDYYAEGPREGRTIRGAEYLMNLVIDNTSGLSASRRPTGISSLDAVSLTPLSSGLSRDLVQFQQRFSTFHRAFTTSVQTYHRLVSKLATDLHGCTSALNCISKTLWESKQPQTDESPAVHQDAKDPLVFAASVGLNPKELRSQISVLTAAASVVHSITSLQRTYLSYAHAADAIIDRLEIGATRACKELLSGDANQPSFDHATSRILREPSPSDSSGPNNGPSFGEMETEPKTPLDKYIRIINDVLDASMDTLIDSTYLLKPACEVFQLLSKNLPRNEQESFAKEESEMLKRLASEIAGPSYAKMKTEYPPVDAMTVCREITNMMSTSRTGIADDSNQQIAFEVDASASEKHVTPEAPTDLTHPFLHSALRNQTQCVNNDELAGCLSPSVLKPAVAELMRTSQNLYRYGEESYLMDRTRGGRDR